MYLYLTVFMNVGRRQRWIWVRWSRAASMLEGQQSSSFEFSFSYVLSVECRHLKVQNPAQEPHPQDWIWVTLWVSWSQVASMLEGQTAAQECSCFNSRAFSRQIQTCDLQDTNKYRTNTRLKVRQQQGNTTAVGPFQWGEEGRGLHCSDAPLVNVSNWTLVIQVRTPHTLSMIKLTPKRKRIVFI